jgi:hypothetical protein
VSFLRHAVAQRIATARLAASAHDMLVQLGDDLTRVSSSSRTAIFEFRLRDK